MRLFRRTVQVSLLVLAHLSLLAVGLLVLLVRRRDRSERQALVGRQAASFCRQAGATFVKLGQVLATRADVLPDPFCHELSGLHEQVGPFPFALVRQTIAEELAQSPEEIFARLDPYPVASASISQVHRGELPDGRVVALKVLRPQIEQQVATDLRAMMLWATVMYWLPVVRRIGLTRVLVEFAEALRQQLDLRLEASNNRRFAENFRGDPTVCVPGLVEQFCSRRVLCMEYVEGERLLEAGRAAGNARELAAAGYRMLLKMIFIDGFVHADLHPGNVVVVRADPTPQLVLFDVGLVTRLSPRHRQALTQLCLAWAARDIAGVCAALAAAAFFEEQPAQPRRLRQQVESLLTRYGDVALGEIRIGRLLLDLLRLVRGQWQRLDPTFSMTAVSIAVVEGVGRQLAPDLRLMAQAMPFFHSQGRPSSRSTMH